APRVGIAVEHVLVDLVDKRLVRVHARGPTSASTASEEARVSIVEVGIDLGREINGRDVGRAIAVLRAQFGIEGDVGDAVARTDPIDGVKAPVNAEENAARSIFRSCLAKAGVVPRLNLPDVVQDEGRDRLMDVARYAV